MKNYNAIFSNFARTTNRQYMFGRRKNNKLIEDIDRYFVLTDQQTLVFKEGVRNYLYSNNE